eukprot:scaffold16220_cov34-Phaeocystis_antarctica.AAC.2
MEAEVLGSLRRTPSRPPRSALGLDGVALRAWRLRRASNPVRFRAASLHDSGDSVARLGDDRQIGPDVLGRVVRA